MRHVIGLSGYARSGKNSVGHILVNDYGFTPLAFADLIKEAAALLELSVFTADHGAMPFGRVIELYGENAKDPEVSDIRRVMVDMGEGLRAILGHDIWVDPVVAAIRRRPYENFVVTDVRQSHEANALRHFFGAQIWRIEREGVVPAEPVEAKTLNEFTSDIVIKNTDIDLVGVEIAKLIGKDA